MAEHDKEVRIKLVADTSDFNGKIDGAFGKAKKSFGDLAKGIMDTIGTFSEIATATNTTSKEIKQLENQMKSTKNAINSKQKELVELNRQMFEYREEITKVAKEEGISSDKAKSLISVHDRLQQEYDKTGKEINELNNKLKSFKDKLSEIKGEVEDTRSSMEQFKDGANSLKDAFTEFNKGDFGKAFESLKDAGQSLFKAMPGWAKAITALYAGLKKLYDMGTQRFFSGLQDIKQTLSPIGNVLSSIGSSFKSSFESITGFDLSLSSAIETAVEFEDTIVRAGGIMGATGDDFNKLEASARQWGATTRYSASDVAEAFTYMGRQTCSAI